MSSADQDRIQAFMQQVATNPQEVLDHLDSLQQRVDNNTTDTPTSSKSTPSPAPMLDPSTLATLAALFQSMQVNQPPANPVPSPAIASVVYKSEKLPDIPLYEGGLNELDAWEQSLIQRLHINRDRYPTEQDKIAYAELRLTNGKKAHNLMGQYRHEGLCYVTSFADWRAKLRACCGNPYEAEDARTYLRDTLKQGSMPFDEYWNLFCQKKERSRMDESSLIDCLKRNVSYSTQTAAWSWRTSLGQRPSTLLEHAMAFKEMDDEMRQLKHRQPRQAQATAGAGSNSQAAKPRSTPNPSNSPLGTRNAPVAPVAPVLSSVGEPMDLSSAMATVKGQKLTNPGVKDICMKWNLCFYCKLQHPGKDAKDCPNKGKSNFRLMNLEATPGPEGGVLLPSGNA